MDNSAGAPRWLLSSNQQSTREAQPTSPSVPNHQLQGPGFPAPRSTPSLQQDVQHRDQLVVAPDVSLVTHTISQTQRHDHFPPHPQASAILNHLKSLDSSCTTLDLSKVVNMTRASVKPVLDQLKSEGLISQLSDSPPLWRITPAGQQAQVAASIGTSPAQPEHSGLSDEVGGDMQCETDSIHHSNADSDEDMDTEETSHSGLNLDLSHIPRENIRDRLIAVFSEDPAGSRTGLELAKEIGDSYSRLQVLPFLETLVSEGYISKLPGFPPKWKALSATNQTVQPQRPQVCWNFYGSF